MSSSLRGICGAGLQESPLQGESPGRRPPRRLAVPAPGILPVYHLVHARVQAEMSTYAIPGELVPVLKDIWDARATHPLCPFGQRVSFHFSLAWWTWKLGGSWPAVYDQLFSRLFTFEDFF